MNTKEIKTKIAAILGLPLVVTRWKYNYYDSEICSKGYLTREAAIKDAASNNVFYEPTEYEIENTFPNWPEDLNACAAFEEFLFDPVNSNSFSNNPKDYAPWRYRFNLAKVVGAQTKQITILDLSGAHVTTWIYSGPSEELKVIRADALKRCEAFLLTFGEKIDIVSP